MSVYVDALWEHGRTAKMPYPVSCHMTADTRAELLAFAARLGLRASWLHESKSMSHFDITPPKRALAVRLGALPMPAGDVHEKMAFMHRIRKQWQAEEGQ